MAGTGLYPRRAWSPAIIFVAVWALAMLWTTAAHAATCPAGASMQIVAHPDDDLLFQSPDVLHDIQAGKCVRTVYVTAGERTADMEHITSREFGVQQAYARMAGVADTWTTSDAGIAGHSIPLVTLAARPNISLVFLRLPQSEWGDPDLPTDETVKNLWLGKVSQMSADDGSSTYTKSNLTATLTSLMNAFQPTTIRAQDYLGSFGDGDHDDHHAVAYFAHAAHLAYAPTHTFIGYLDYATENNPQNVSGADFTNKKNAFYAYLAWDEGPCGLPPDCGTNEYTQWLGRQYIVGKEPADAGVPTPPSPDPITTVTSPTAGQTVYRTINVAATVVDHSGSGIWLTAFRVDSPSADATNVDYASPFGFSLDTTKLSDGQHTLYVRAADNAGNVGPDATITFTVDNAHAPPPGPPPPSPDPITTVTSPTAGQTVSGKVNVAATVVDHSGSGIWLTAFRVDSSSGDPAAVDYESPFGFSLDTTKLTDGQHTLYVRSADHAGDVGPDATVTFTVDNAHAPPPGPPPPSLDPITTVTSPAVGQTVSGTINVAATVQDQSGSGIWLTAF